MISKNQAPSAVSDSEFVAVAGPLLHRLGGLAARALEGHGLAADAPVPGRAAIWMSGIWVKNSEGHDDKLPQNHRF